GPNRNLMLTRFATAGTRASGEVRALRRAPPGFSLGLWRAALLALLVLPWLVPPRAVAATPDGAAVPAPGAAAARPSADADRLVPLGPGDSITLQVYVQP